MSKSDYIKNGKRVGCKGYSIDNEEIKRLYLGQNLTLKEIGKKLGISHWTVLSRLKKIGARKNTRHSINHKSFEVFTPESCYWAGFVAADGSMHKDNRRIEIEIKYSDRLHLNSLCHFIGRDHKLWHRDRVKNNKIYKASAVSIVSKNVVYDLRTNFNITPRKTSTLKPPTQIPSYLVSHFIRGYVDGDGSIGWHKHNKTIRLHICSGSEEFLKWIKSTIKNNVSIYNPSVRKRSNSNLYEIEFMGKQAGLILDWLYKDSTNETRLERKFSKYKKLIGE